jgi:hypothetical protein
VGRTSWVIAKSRPIWSDSVDSSRRSAEISDSSLLRCMTGSSGSILPIAYRDLAFISFD